MTLDAGLAVVEGLDGGEAAAVDGLAADVDVHPAVAVAGAGEALVVHVEVVEPAAVEEVAVAVDVRRAAVVTTALGALASLTILFNLALPGLRMM